MRSHSLKNARITKALIVRLALDFSRRPLATSDHQAWSAAQIQKDRIVVHLNDPPLEFPKPFLPGQRKLSILVGERQDPGQ